MRSRKTKAKKSTLLFDIKTETDIKMLIQCSMVIHTSTTVVQWCVRTICDVYCTKPHAYKIKINTTLRARSALSKSFTCTLEVTETYISKASTLTRVCLRHRPNCSTCNKRSLLALSGPLQFNAFRPHTVCSPL